MVLYCCITVYPQTLWLKTTLIYHLTVTVGQEFGHSLAESSGSRSLTRLSIEISLGAAVTSRLNGGRISFLGGCWIKASVPNELFGQRLFSVFFARCASLNKVAATEGKRK